MAALEASASASTAELLATGVPRRRRHRPRHPETRVATFYGAFTSCTFDTKSGGLKVTFLVPAEHQLLALGVRDMARSRLVLEVHSPSAGARERYGRNSATAPTTDQLRAQEIRDRIEHDHARRQVQRAMKQWTGPDGPEDSTADGI
jgi:hypothetical protein